MGSPPPLAVSLLSSSTSKLVRALEEVNPKLQLSFPHAEQLPCPRDKPSSLEQDLAPESEYMWLSNT